MSETAQAEAVRKMSASILAAGTGLGGEEINWLLHRAGLLDGQPGAWSLTEKAAAYASERLDSYYHHSWPVITWDPAVLGELDLSDAGKHWARQAVKDWRLAKKAAREAAAALPAVADRAATAAEHAAAGRTVDTQALAKVMLPALGVAVVAGYGLHKVRRRWKERAGAPEQARDRGDRGARPEGLT